MKALTLTQPWATLVAIGAKRIETRSWSTSYRGPLAIHAAAGLGPVGGKTGLLGLCRSEPFRSALLAAGILGTPALPLGAIVAVAELVDCLPTRGQRLETGGGPKYADWVHDLSSTERAFGDYTPGRYGWTLANIRALETPIPARGALSLWQPDAATLARLAAPRCPHCGAMHDLTGRVSGDRVYCVDRDAWYQVHFTDGGGAQLLACDAPAAWPKERRGMR